MPDIVQSRFGGMYPRMNPRLLPDEAAAYASNVDLRDGTLVPANALPLPRYTLRDADGNLLHETTAQERTAIGVPAQITLYDLVNMVGGLAANAIYVRRYAFIIDHDNGTTGTHYSDLTAGSADFKWTEDGLEIAARDVAGFSYAIPAGATWSVHGPIYRLTIGSTVLPAVVTPGHPMFSTTAVPYFYNGELVANVQCIDIASPSFTLERFTAGVNGLAMDFGSNYGVHLRFRLNYTAPTRRFFYYVCCAKSGDADGPPSPVSERIIVPPGRLPRLDIDQTHGPVDIYRSETGNDGSFYRVSEDQASALATDSLQTPESELLPPYGNCPSGIQQTQIHAANFAVGWKGDTLYCSDVFRLWAWPEEFTVPFPESIKFIQVLANRVLVWCTEGVYAVVGNHPERLGRVLLSAANRLLDTRQIARVGSTVYWVTDDGLAASDGGAVQIVTRKHFTRDEWGAIAFGSNEMSAADNTVWMPPLRFDLDGEAVAVSWVTPAVENVVLEGRFFRPVTPTSSTPQMTWTSKLFTTDQPVSYSHVRIDGDASVALTVTADGVDYPLTVPDDTVMALPTIPPAREWQFKLVSSGHIRRLMRQERKAIPADGGFMVTPEQTPSWKGIYAEFAKGSRPSAVLVRGTAGTGTITLSAAALATDEDVAFTMNTVVLLPRSLPLDSLWRIDVAAAGEQIDAVQVFERQHVAAEVVRGLRQGGVPDWLRASYQFGRKRYLQAVYLDAGAAIAGVRIFKDGESTPAYANLTLQPGMNALPDNVQARSVEIDFGGNDHKVREFTLYSGESEQAGGPVVFEAPQHMRNRRVLFPAPNSFAAVQVDSTIYPVTVTVSSGGNSYALHVADAKPVRLPLGQVEACAWTVDVSGEPTRVVLYPWVQQEVRDRAALGGGGGRCPAWYYTEYVSAKPERVKSVLLSGPTFGDGFTFTLYARGSATAAFSETVYVGKESLVDYSITPRTGFVFDFGAHNLAADAVYVWFHYVRTVGEGAVVLDAADSLVEQRLLFADAVRIGAVQAAARAYPDFSIVVNGQTVSIPGEAAVQVPRASGRSPFHYLTWSGSWRPDSLMIYPSYDVDAANPLVVEAGSTLEPWLMRRFVYPGPTRVLGVRIAGAACVLRVYADDAATPTQSISLAADGHAAITGLVCTTLEFDFQLVDLTGPAEVHRVELFAESVQEAGPVNVIAQPYGQVLVSSEAMEPSYVEVVSGGAAAVTLAHDAGVLATYSFLEPGGQHIPPNAVLERKRLEVRLEESVTARARVWLRQPVHLDGFELRLKGQGNPWRAARYYWPETAPVTSVRVIAASYPVTMTAYVGTTQTLTITGPHEHLVEGWKHGSIAFHFGDDDSDVEAVHIQSERSLEVNPQEPTRITRQMGARGVLLVSPEAMRWACAYVQRGTDDAGAIVLKLWRQGSTGIWSLEEEHTLGDDLTGSGVFVFAQNLDAGNAWKLDISGSFETATLYPVITRAQEGPVLLEGGTGAVPPWLYLEFHWAKPVQLGSVYVEARENVNFRAYAGGSLEDSALGQGSQALSTAEQLAWRFDCGAEDEKVRRLIVYPQTPVPVTGQGVLLRQAGLAQSWTNVLLRFAEVGRFKAIRVISDDASVGLTLASSAETVTATLASGMLTVLDAAAMAQDWTLTLDAAERVHEVHLFAAVKQGFQEGRVEMRRGEGELWTWRYQMLYAPRPLSPGVVVVDSEQYPVQVDFHADGVLVHTQKFFDGRATRVPQLRRAKNWVVDVHGDGLGVHRVAVAVNMGVL